MSFGMEKGIGNLTFIVRANAAFVRRTIRALAIYPSRTPMGMDSRSGWKTKGFFGDSDTHLGDSEGDVQRVHRNVTPEKTVQSAACSHSRAKTRRVLARNRQEIARGVFAANAAFQFGQVVLAAEVVAHIPSFSLFLHSVFVRSASFYGR